jgi:hypothetical protein
LVEPVTVTFDRDTTHQDLRYDESSLLYNGGSVIGWLRLRAAQIVVFNPSLQGPVVARFNLKQSALFSIGGQDVMIHSWSINFHPHTQWLKQTVQLDAKAGIYDYIRGRVRFTPGSNSYTISGIDFDKAIPLSYAPEMHEIGVGLMPGEIDAALVYVQGLAPAQGVKIADLDNLIVPNDLNPKNPQLLMQRTSQ